jgi:hypothetical protein
VTDHLAFSYVFSQVSIFSRESDNFFVDMNIYNIGALTVNIQFMWRGLETGERRALANLHDNDQIKIKSINIIIIIIIITSFNATC